MEGPKKIILSLSTGLALSVCLFLSFLLYTGAKSLDEMAVSAQKAVKLELFFNGEVQPEVLGWIDGMKARFEIQDVTLLDQQEARVQFVELMKPDWGSLAEDQALLETVPSSVVVHFQSGLVSEKLKGLSQAIINEAKSFVGYDSAIFQKDWAQWLSQYQTASNNIALAFFVMIAWLIFLVISNLNRSLIFKNAREIEVKYLVGATQVQIAKPFVIKSMVVGGLAFGVAFMFGQLSVNKAQTILADLAVIKSPQVLELTIAFLFVLGVCAVSANSCVREQMQ
jgi:cell division protein FtsX